MIKNKKVIVGMSGGIDSSVTALLLKNEGYEVIGVSIKHLSDEFNRNNNKTCCSLDDINDAKIVCYKLGIPHYVINVEKEFKKEIIKEFISDYKKGLTPNPCVICNEKVKIKTLIDMAKNLGFSYVATGHYARKSEDGYLLYTNYSKDQSYMLYRLTKEDLDMMLFPLSDMKKSLVREIAKENGIQTHDKLDSQGICFAPDGYDKFLKENLNLKKGDFIYKDKVIAQHEGYALYTIGQRRGLNVKLPHPVFITKIDEEKNIIYLGDFEELMVDEVEISDYIFHKKLEDILEKRLFARPRSSSKGRYGILKQKNNELIFKYEDKNHENAKGQHIVFYLNEELIGGGKILK
ncbi:tRNA 2-thiouridine(34) synthase MnmA [Oceanivirga miroungae]|uniref:tRNA-specific 2-thiouridylase MnmA n=1 Tax=Oceanivirga miroungae TaxID=1130046 RepID=A0A6I8M7K4_9FUSO|nr:tRNA 2-thiouridine(34) synthase MnmA [Oceanivirga miroungae]VWL84800.1 tRNA(5-methylaminomethyl-2-thiouridylate)-methyl transferase [Oceanivirga miroungae]